MSGGLRVAQPPSKPLVVFDGECHFCGLWISRWRQLTGDAVDYLPSQDPRIAEAFPEISRGQFDNAVQLIATDGAVYSGAEAVFRLLAHNSYWRWLPGMYQSFPLFAALSEGAYGFVAGHRPLFSALTRGCWGRHVEAPSYFLVRWLFLRALGLVYLFAFVSLWTQVNGLIGHNGILPAGQFMSAVKQQCDQQGIGAERFYLLPTLCWLNASDGFLNFLCATGTAASVLLVAGLGPAPCLAALWLLYLSLVIVGRDFMGFQWDCLLLEAGFLAIFLAPLQLLPRPSREAPPSRLFVWMLRLLLFKLMLSSGCVKLLSGDPNWRNLTALTFHYQTQPLPPWTAWYANLLPLWFQKLSCAVLFGIEIGAPFLIFTPRRIRFLGAALLAGLQLLILLTGNYTFFNWLSMALCVLLLDDFLLEKIVPRKFALCFPGPPFQDVERGRPRPQQRSSHQWFSGMPSGLSARKLLRPGRARSWPFPLLAVIAAIILMASSYMLAATLDFRSPWLMPLGWVAGKLAPFRTVNNYGLFAVMTTERNEIIVEGSNDGTNWLAYEFKYKPGDVKHRPAFVAPLQPRLDWQMWFAALGTYQQNPWFENFCERLLQGPPEVLALLAKNPFPEHPPRFIRAQFYNYKFTDFTERRATGAWWKREFIGKYMPVVSLRE